MLNTQQETLVGSILFRQPESITLQALLALERDDWNRVFDLTLGSMNPDMSSKITTAAILADRDKALDALTHVFVGTRRPENMIACGLAGTILGLFESVREFRPTMARNLVEFNREQLDAAVAEFETRSIWVAAEIVASRQWFMMGLATTISKTDMASIDGAVKSWVRDDASRCHKLAVFLETMAKRHDTEVDFSDFGKALLGSMAFGVMANWNGMQLFSAVASPTVDPVRIAAEAEAATFNFGEKTGE